MSIKESNLPFYQIPKILIEDKRINGDHIFIFMILYDGLRTYPEFNKTNKFLSEKTNIGLSQLKLRLNEIEEFGFLKRSGFGSKRKFSLGDKFINRSESIPVSKSNRPEINPIQAGIDTSNRPESGLHNKNKNKNNIKNKKSENYATSIGPVMKELVIKLKNKY